MLPVFLFADTNTDRFKAGDYLFVRAQVIECGSTPLFVEGSQVMSNGQVTLFSEILLEANGKSTSEVASELLSLLEQRTGFRSRSIKVMRVPAEDTKKSAEIMYLVLRDRSRDCRSDKQEWFQLARGLLHNKSLNTDACCAGAG
jgi:hypothetical protein